MGLTHRLRTWARRLRAEIYALSLAYRDPRTPWLAKALTAAIIAYALSPIDLIPDVIPVLGYLDDLVLLPLAIALVLKLVPADVMAESRKKAEETLFTRQRSSLVVVAVVVALWVLTAFLIVLVAFRIAH